MKLFSIAAFFLGSIMLTSCSGKKENVAKVATEYGICQLRDGAACKAPLPKGWDHDTYGVVEGGDAVVLNTKLSSPEQCREFVLGVGLNPGPYAVQAYVNGVVVVAYGTAQKLNGGEAKVCATSPAVVKLLVAKWPTVS